MFEARSSVRTPMRGPRADSSSRSDQTRMSRVSEAALAATTSVQVSLLEVMGVA